MEKKEKISIIVPIYNVADCIEKNVEHLVHQTWPGTEIILINDGSRDDSLAVCRKMQQKYPQIIVIDQENQGVSVARNSGLAAATGEWVCFVDGDDWLENDALEKMAAYCRPGTDIILTDYYVATKSTRWEEAFLRSPERFFSSREDTIELIRNCFVHTPLSNHNTITMIGVPWAKLFRTSFLKKHNILFHPSLRKMQDAIFNAYAFINAENIHYVKIKTYDYWQNEQSVTHKGNPAYRKITSLLLRAFRKFIKTYHLEKELVPVYNTKRFMFAFECVKFIYLLDEGGMTLQQKLRGTAGLMSRMHFSRSQKRKIFSYLGKAYRIAFILYELHMYRMIYFMADLYLKMKNHKYYK